MKEAYSLQGSSISSWTSDLEETKNSKYMHSFTVFKLHSQIFTIYIIKDGYVFRKRGEIIPAKGGGQIWLLPTPFSNKYPNTNLQGKKESSVLFFCDLIWYWSWLLRSEKQPLHKGWWCPDHGWNQTPPLLSATGSGTVDEPAMKLGRCTDFGFLQHRQQSGPLAHHRGGRHLHSSHFACQSSNTFGEYVWRRLMGEVD